MSSPLESGHIGDEFLLFPGNMVISGGAQYSDKDEDDDEQYSTEIVNMDKNMHIINVSIPGLRSNNQDIAQVGNKALNMVQGLQSDHRIIAMTDTPESPEQEEMNVDPSPEHYSHMGDEELLANLDSESEIVIIDPTVKSPENPEISTKEDFEELIDKDTRKDTIIKPDTVTATKHITELHKYAANTLTYSSKLLSTSSLQQTPSVSHVVSQHNFNSKPNGNVTKPKLTFITASVAGNVNVSPTVKSNATQLNMSDGVFTTRTKLNSSSPSNVTSIIFPMKTTVSQAITLVTASNSRFTTIPVISASAISKLPNVKIIDKTSSSLSLTTQETCLPKKIFDDESSVSPDSSVV